ncbi:hypothetical protein ACJMK2_036966 [Sinanodonta woodiana]|uniref:Dynamin N-terminal domain-containing protein n=1 Tax=Sinanodonta woodiana TaxID=1069815 RepID=A0ABD3WIT8_SINWO
MKYDDVVRFLLQLGVTISANSGENIKMLKEKLYGGRAKGPSDEKARYMVDITMKKYQAVKRQLIDSYSKCIDITNMDTFKQDLQKPLQKRFPDFIKKMRNTLEALKKDSSEFQIAIFGETSAGRSTILNLLLGEKILPSALLHTTACICRLHNSSDRKISYIDKDDNKIVQLTSDDSIEIEQTLLTIFGSGKHNITKSLRVVDIYWPIPLLQEDIILVVTPGIGNTNLLTKQIVEYVPKADGYICIIDSSHAGGVQEDRIEFLLREIKRKGPEMRDFSNIMFICNKWDRVQQHDVDSVWDDTWNKLELVCGRLEKWQVIKFCSTLELKLQHLKANHTDAFVDILTGIENVLLGAMYKRTGCKHEYVYLNDSLTNSNTHLLQMMPTQITRFYLFISVADKTV